MHFIAKNPMSIPEIDYTPTTPSNTRGIFAKKDGFYEIDSLGDVRKIATLGTNTIKEIPESKIDELYFNNPSFVEDGVFLVTDDSIDGKYGRNQYFLITSTQTDRPNVKERDLDYLGSTTQYRFHYYGGIQSRKITPELSDGGLYVYNWTQWEPIGSGGGSGDLDAHRNNEDENAKHLVTEVLLDCTQGQSAYQWVNSDSSKCHGMFKLVETDGFGDVYSVSYLISTYISAVNGYNQIWINEYGDNTSIKYRSFDGVIGDSTKWYEWITKDEHNEVAQEVSFLRLDVDTLIEDKADKTDLDALKAEICPPPINNIPATLEQNKAYEFGTHETLSLSFPSTASNGDVIYVSFLSRDIPTNLTVNTTNTTDFDLIPEINTGYEIYAKYNVSIGCWIVKYSEYSIEGM